MKHRIFPILFIASLVSLAVFSIPAFAYSADAVKYYDQGNALFKTKNYTAAIAAYDNAIALEPNYSEAWNAKADALNKDKQFLNALAASDKALSINPNDLQSWLNRGTILYMLGRYEDEQKAYDKAIEIDPSNTTAWFFKGFSLGGLKRYDEAIAAFDKVKSLDPSYPRIDYYHDMAVQMKNEESPFSFKNLFYVLVAIVVIGGAGAWFFLVRKKYS